ncbi:hypothetical protein [Methylomicrobium sp. Wu6]|uniref:hypothetical protein n=1 Tax=Methylomicrobium sp. Wu6 TaxID=3107928 RepID=UPI002DD6B5B3|nr:hypothetical protein [Methylomicrobium sp. Wu6]MEC4747712.1 hypothetical protein [Methylomicrobium sp. Wu6]
MKKISMDEFADLYFKLDAVETLTRPEVVIHTGEHPDFGDIVIMQWGGDDHAFLNIR